ncbi:IncP-type conjugal transfer protein TraG [Caulobacter segnis]|nr:IncP-type conjugal transfer protein TraG [Caulobacter segnis]
MTAARIQWLPILIVAAIVLTTTWTATQWTASALGDQAGLGPPWFVLAGHRIYPPPAFFWWWFVYDAYAPRIFLRGAMIAASGGLLSAAVAIGMSVARAKERGQADTFGSARWASDREIRRVGLLKDDGVILGRYDEAYLRHAGPEHVLCFAPTRSGKGVGLVVPTLLTWPGSTIVHDIKGENWSLTAGFRARLGKVLLFDPTNPEASAYNPLLEVRQGESEVRDVQNIADILVDPEGSLDKRSHWEKTSHSLLVGAILHVLYAEPDKTLAGVANFLSDPKRTIEQTLSVMMRAAHLGEAGPHPVVASAARELLNKSDNERSGVLSTAMTFLGLYRDPVVAKVTSRCDWRISDLVHSPCSLYLVVPPSDVSRTKPLIRLILNQIVRRLTETLTGVAQRQKLLLMLDELPVLGRLDFLESTLAFMAGYGVRAFLITQSLALAADVLVEGDFAGVVGGVDHAPNGRPLGQGLALGQQAQGLAAAFADGHQIVAGLAAVLLHLRLDHERLQQALGLDAGRARLDHLGRMAHAPGVARRGLQAVEGDVTHLADLGGGGGLGSRSHVCLLGVRSQAQGAPAALPVGETGGASEGAASRGPGCRAWRPEGSRGFDKARSWAEGASQRAGGSAPSHAAAGAAGKGRGGPPMPATRLALGAGLIVGLA